MIYISSRFISFLPKRLPNSNSPFPYLSLLDQCRSMQGLKQIHAHLIVLGLIRFSFVTSRLLAFCALSNCRFLDYASLIFNRIALPSIFDWNAMIQVYTQGPKPKLGLSIFIRMRALGVSPNPRTFPFTIKSCSSLLSVSQVHGQVVKFGFDMDVYVVSSFITTYSSYGRIETARRMFDMSPSHNIVSWTSLISGYCHCGLVDEARKMFDEMPERNDVCWGAMVSGYVKNDLFEEAINLFHKWRCQVDLKPSRSLLVSVLSACAGLGASKEGKWIHAYLEQHGFEYGLELGTALIDFYAKFGCVENARHVFRKMPRKDVTAWSALIMGLAINGLSNLALDHFDLMQKSGTEPNEITFIGVLTACKHGGLVDRGWELFSLMRDVYQISPTIEHYGCIVDLLGRAGHICEAEELINNMPIKPDGIVLGALLNGCVMHGHLELAEKLGTLLIDLEPRHSGRYVLLANIYGKMGHWHGLLSVRKMMRERKVAPVPGCSFLGLADV